MTQRDVRQETAHAIAIATLTLCGTLLLLFALTYAMR